MWYALAPAASVCVRCAWRSERGSDHARAVKERSCSCKLINSDVVARVVFLCVNLSLQPTDCVGFVYLDELDEGHTYHYCIDAAYSDASLRLCLALSSLLIDFLLYFWFFCAQQPECSCGACGVLCRMHRQVFLQSLPKYYCSIMMPVWIVVFYSSDPTYLRRAHCVHSSQEHLRHADYVDSGAGKGVCTAVGFSDAAPAVERGETVAVLSHGVLDAFDLLKRMLSFFPEDRIGAAEALEHPFFAPIRERDTEVGHNLNCLIADAVSRQGLRLAVCVQFSRQTESDGLSHGCQCGQCQFQCIHKLQV